MAESNDIESVPKEKNKLSFVGRLFISACNFVNSLPVRLVVIFLSASVIASLIADVLYPQFVINNSQKVSRQLAIRASTQTPQSEIVELLRNHNLAWYYMTNADYKISTATKPFAPDVDIVDNVSHKLEWRNNNYYEAVVPVKGKQFLHIGFYIGPIAETALRNHCLPSAVPTVYMLIVLTTILSGCLAGMMLFVSRPLQRLARACASLLLSRDAYSGVTGGALTAAGAVTEVDLVASALKTLRRQYDSQRLMRLSKEDELKRATQTFQAEKRKLTDTYEHQITSMTQKVTELQSKEAEEEFISTLNTEIETLNYSHQVGLKILERLNDKFPNSITHAAVFTCDDNQHAKVEASLGFDDESLRLLKLVDHRLIARDLFSSGQHQAFRPDSFQEFDLHDIGRMNSFKIILYLPLIFNQKNIGLLAIYFTDIQSLQNRLKVLRNVAQIAAKSLYKVIIYQEELEAGRTDPLTGLRNRKYFQENMPRILEAAALNRINKSVSILMLDADHFKEINDHYGHQVGDQVLRQLAKIFRESVRSHDGGKLRSRNADELIRIGGEEFLIVLDQANSELSHTIAERIRRMVEERQEWPGGIARVTVSIGGATFPGSGKTVDELVMQADRALYYAKEKLGRNHSCHANEVPASFKNAKVAPAILGELGVFDPASLLQSIASAQKTGVLTVRANDGRQFWMSFEDGRALQARLGPFAGHNAILEFITTFEDGNFNFQENVLAKSDSRFAKLDESFDIKRGLQRLMLDAALIQDNFNIAKVILPSLDVCIKPVNAEEFSTRIWALNRTKDPPSQEELELMNSIVAKSEGGATLKEIFSNSNGIPTKLLWRAAALLIEHNLVHLHTAAKDALSASDPVSAHKEATSSTKATGIS